MVRRAIALGSELRVSFEADTTWSQHLIEAMPVSRRRRPSHEGQAKPAMFSHLRG